VASEDLRFYTSKSTYVLSEDRMGADFARNFCSNYIHNVSSTTLVYYDNSIETNLTFTNGSSTSNTTDYMNETSYENVTSFRIEDNFVFTR